MVLESLNQEKNTSRIIHIIRPTVQRDVFKLGRGHESDLRINDISVSRCHAKIKFVDGKFMLEDNQSKFGTLVLVKQRTPLLPGYNKAVQVGRTVINFSVKATHRRDAQQDPLLDEDDNNQFKHEQDMPLQRHDTRAPGELPVLPQV
jgi:predicted component of type VI protein secretion system